MKNKNKRTPKSQSPFKSLFLIGVVIFGVFLFLAYFQLFHGGIVAVLKNTWYQLSEKDKEVKVEGIQIGSWNKENTNGQVLLLENDAIYYGSDTDRAIPPGSGRPLQLQVVQNYILATALDGTILWKTNLPVNEGLCGVAQMAGSVLLSPTSKNELVDEVTIWPVETSIFATDKEKGEQLWQAKTNGGRCPTFSHDETSIFWVALERQKNLEEILEKQDFSTFIEAPVKANLLAINTLTGEQKWVQELGSNVCEEIALNEDTVFTMTAEGLVTAFDKNSGIQQWQQQTSLPGCGSLSVRGNELEVLRNYHSTFSKEYPVPSMSVSRFNVATGESLLIQEFKGEVGVRGFSFLPVISGDIVLLTVDDQHFYQGQERDWIEAYDLKSKSLKWKFTPEDPKLLIRTAPFVVNDAVYLALQYGQELYMLDKDTGEVLKKTFLMSQNGPHKFIESNGKLIVANSYLEAFDAATLDRIWWVKERQTKQQFNLPAVIDDYLHTTDSHGLFYRLKL